MNIKAWNALLVIALLIVLSGGGYILYQNNEQKQIELAQKEAEAKEAAERAHQEKIEQAQRFEDFINGFLQQVASEVADYKKSRNVLKNLVEPANLREPEYIQENAKLAESLVMSLQLKMDDVMKSFEAADQKAQTLINELEGESQKTIQEKWIQVRDENAQKFAIYFSMEQDILTAHLRLIEFYEAHSDELEIDVANGHILFEDINLQEEEAMLRGRIMEFRVMQQDVLREANENN